MSKKKRSGVTAPEGFIAGGSACGVKKNGAKDLALIVSDRPATSWGVFTTNTVKGAPVIWSRDCLKNRWTRGIVVNSGNSNVLTKHGLAHAKRMAEAAAKHIGCKANQVFVASTGVIGQPLPIENIERGVDELFPKISANGGVDAAEAIMTTDLVKKEGEARLSIGGKTVTIGACAKGSGMIAPSMATMLCFVTCDAALSREVVKDLTKRASDNSFNKITVDGDSSTSDTLILMTNGASGAPMIEKPSGARYSELLEKVTGVCVKLAHSVVRDGEGATKFVTVSVSGARNDKDAEKVAATIARSPLVKTALFGEDPNWGRIMCAAGYSGVSFDTSKVTLKIGGVTIFTKGGLSSADWEEKAAPKLKEKNVKIHLDLGRGKGASEVWTCDLSYDYVRINADYRS